MCHRNFATHRPERFARYWFSHCSRGSLWYLGAGRRKGRERPIPQLHFNQSAPTLVYLGLLESWRLGESSVAYRMFGNTVKFLNLIGIICCWRIQTKFLSFISSSVLKDIWNNSKLIACRYCYSVILIFFSGLIEPFILCVVLWIRTLGSWAVCLPGFMRVGEVQAIHFQGGIFAHVSNDSVPLGFSCCPPGALDPRVALVFQVLLL